MATAFTTSLIEALLGARLGSTDEVQGNRLSLEGLAWGSAPDGTLQMAIRKLEAASLRFAMAPLAGEVGRLTVHQLAARIRLDEGRPRLLDLEAPDAELSGVKLHGPLVLASSPSATSETIADAWRLGPLAEAEGALRAQIVDAHLLFDADVTVPIHHGRIHFNDATIEHVGPDSRMGVSPQGIYIDAPNGRSYLYQFTNAPVAGVEYEQRDALLGPWISRRGSLGLQAFLEGLLPQILAGAGLGLTRQARELLDRTSLAGEMQLGDGSLALHGVQGQFAGRAEGRNRVRLHSPAVGRGISAEVAALSMLEVAANTTEWQLVCGQATGALALQLSIEGGNARFTIGLDNLKVAGLGLRPPHAANDAAVASTASQV